MNDLIAKGSRSQSPPLGFVEAFCRRHPEIESLEIGVYRYEPQTVSDKRRVVPVPPHEIARRYRKIENRLDPGEEIALQSRVSVRAKRQGWAWPWASRERTEVRHIPMIDFQGDVSEANLEGVAHIALDFRCDEMAVFFSGRSCHFYGFALLTQDEWIQFMGRILLLNLPGQPAVVDSRWVGHRLIAGYSALRWSRNTRHYKQHPELRYHWPENAHAWQMAGSGEPLSSSRSAARRSRGKNRPSVPQEREQEQQQPERELAEV